MRILHFWYVTFLQKCSEATEKKSWEIKAVLKVDSIPFFRKKKKKSWEKVDLFNLSTKEERKAFNLTFLYIHVSLCIDLSIIDFFWKEEINMFQGKKISFLNENGFKNFWCAIGFYRGELRYCAMYFYLTQKLTYNNISLHRIISSSMTQMFLSQSIKWLKNWRNKTPINFTRNWFIRLYDPKYKRVLLYRKKNNLEK